MYISFTSNGIGCRLKNPNPQRFLQLFIINLLDFEHHPRRNGTVKTNFPALITDIMLDLGWDERYSIPDIARKSIIDYVQKRILTLKEIALVRVKLLLFQQL